ncbi:MAG: class I SAM-dependent methyltransferase [Bacteroidia bacterium]
MASVNLAQSLACGFIFNGTFDPSKMDYDLNYQNEQSNSVYFQEHLENIIDLMESQQLLNGKIIEIGCGKGYFLNMLRSLQKDVTGFDPTYEGDSEFIIRDYYSSKYESLEADFIVLRHTLEHIYFPLKFLQQIASANKYKGKIYIEVPAFEWIQSHNAVEDIFYEHCNYFTRESLQLLFKNSRCEYVFNGQYLALTAELKDIKSEVEIRHLSATKVHFKDKITKYSQFLSTLNNVAIWGAGAKGSTFVNLIDPTCSKVRCVIDINTKKQNQYIGGSGHLIISPDDLKKYAIKTIIVMNPNYLEEIKSQLSDPSYTLLTIE